MTKVRAIIAALILAVSVLAVSGAQPAEAQKRDVCSAPFNLPGGWLSASGTGTNQFRTVLRVKECDGYDEVWAVWVDGYHAGACGVISGGAFKGVTGWKANPNAIGPWNPGDSYTTGCSQDMGNFQLSAPIWFRGAPVTIYASMTAAAKCAASTVTTFRTASAGPAYVQSTPTVCVDGY